ncbi:MAG TPA: valine--tRNA ligase [Chitinophagaceae bacterium]|nr:valine--tRNA ligase [Chitinophagaceae bacterium]
MELSKNYVPSGVDDKWYSHWIAQRYFSSKPDGREAYTVVIPPPNVTGVLHMGHCLNNTIQDVLVRRARMQGKNACWVPGTDHASIATEAKVVGMLRERGINKSTLTRPQFLDYAWEWKEKYGGIILQQLRKLGCSLDWDRTTFTMDPDYYRSVIQVFVDLYKKGYIYRGKRMIHWDPKAKTALSDEEVIYKEVNSKLYHIKYHLDNGNGEAQPNEYITIATVRPETILGDTAICVHPKDERYAHLKGRFAFVPLINRRIPIIFDEYVTMEFGTGALKVTPAHDMNDYQLGQKHGLEVIDILTEDGRLNEAAQLYIGEDRFEARKKIAKDLQEKGYLLKTEDYTNQLGFSERTDAVVEPRLSLQWWVRMKEISDPALQAVMNDDIRFYPAKFKNLYRHWMENIRDWCISRQLWWGHRIPAWYTPDGNFYVAESVEHALQQAQADNPQVTIDQLTQDEDCLDTWFSSWLWPFEVFKGFSHPGNEDIKYYYPTNTLVTAPEIIFFWVARMIMAGFEYMKEKPFSEVYFTGIVRDKLGRKMSKQLGNSPDLLGLIDQYGADAVRFGILIASPAGNDLLYDDASLEQGRNFNNKLWNALKLVKGWKTDETIEQPEPSKLATEWFEARFNEQLQVIDEHYAAFRISDALMATYKLAWDDFCSWYLEMIKPEFVDGKSKPIDSITYTATVEYFEKILRLLHPFMPFITEEIWHLIRNREKTDSIVIAPWPIQNPFNREMVASFEGIKEHISMIRNIRNMKNIPQKEKIELLAKSEPSAMARMFDPVVIKLCNLKELRHNSEKPANAVSFVSLLTEFYIPVSSVNLESEKERLLKELNYNKEFLNSVNKKLSNEKFVQNAKPEVVALEQRKRADAEAKIKAIEESLAQM